MNTFQAPARIYAVQTLGLPIRDWPALQNEHRDQGCNLSLGCGKTSKSQNQAAICEGTMNDQVPRSVEFINQASVILHSQ